MASFLMTTVAAAAITRQPKNGTKVPFIGKEIKNYFPEGSFREAPFLGQMLRMPNPVDNCVCKNRIEWVHLQDTTSSFGALLSYWKDFSQELGEAIEQLFPGTKMALSSFSDKPLPFLGYGWGHVSDNLKKDYCYRNHMDFVTPAEFADYVQDFPPASGGNDAPENQFGAAVNAMYDPNLHWSDGVDADGTEVIKVMSLMTNSTSHGIRVNGKTKPDGSKWGGIPNLHNGYDLWWAAEFWNYSYGKQHISDSSNNRPYKSWIFDTKSELSFHEFCGPDSMLIEDYVYLGKKITDNVPLSNEEQAKWQEVTTYCDPANMNDYIGVSQEELGTNAHPGRFVSEDECLTVEYPNQMQMAEEWKKNNVHPIVQVIQTETDNRGLPWYRWAYGCPHDNEYKCVSQFYKDIFADQDIEVRIDAPKMKDGLDQWVSSLLEMVNDIWVENCNCVTTTTTTTESTTTPTKSTTTDTTMTSPAPDTTTGGGNCDINLVCDTCDCITWPNMAIWTAMNANKDKRYIVEGSCDGVCDNCHTECNKTV